MHHICITICAIQWRYLWWTSGVFVVYLWDTRRYLYHTCRLLVAFLWYVSRNTPQKSPKHTKKVPLNFFGKIGKLGPPCGGRLHGLIRTQGGGSTTVRFYFVNCKINCYNRLGGNNTSFCVISRRGGEHGRARSF